MPNRVAGASWLGRALHVSPVELERGETAVSGTHGERMPATRRAAEAPLPAGDFDLGIGGSPRSLSDARERRGTAQLLRSGGTHRPLAAIALPAAIGLHLFQLAVGNDMTHSAVAALSLAEHPVDVTRRLRGRFEPSRRRSRPAGRTGAQPGEVPICAALADILWVTLLVWGVARASASSPRCL